MTQEAFEQSLRDFLRREPFQPFVVELVDGGEIMIDAPHSVALCEGNAGFLSPDYEIVEFSCAQTRAIRLARQEISS